MPDDLFDVPVKGTVLFILTEDKIGDKL